MRTEFECAVAACASACRTIFRTRCTVYASCERIRVRLLRCFRHHAAREVETRWIVCVNVIEPNKQHLLGILGPSQQSSGVCAVALGFADVPAVESAEPRAQRSVRIEWNGTCRRLRHRCAYRRRRRGDSEPCRKVR